MFSAQIKFVGIDIAKYVFQIPTSRVGRFCRRRSADRHCWSPSPNSFLHCSHGSVCDRSSLGARDRRSWPRSEANSASIR
jgi:hypothetical protein